MYGPTSLLPPSTCPFATLYSTDPARQERVDMNSATSLLSREESGARVQHDKGLLLLN